MATDPTCATCATCGGRGYLESENWHEVEYHDCPTCATPEPQTVTITEEDLSILSRANAAAKALLADIDWPRPSLQPHALNISYIADAERLLDHLLRVVRGAEDHNGSR